MTFSEVDQRYITLKERFAAGEITAEQFDDELLNMMVQDVQGRWWAKARLSGEWHYYDAATEDWQRADPPGAAAPPELLIPPTKKAVVQPSTIDQPGQPAPPQGAKQQPTTHQPAQPDKRVVGTKQPAPTKASAVTEPAANASGQTPEPAPAKTVTGFRWAKHAPKQSYATTPTASTQTGAHASPPSTAASAPKSSAVAAAGSGASVKGVPVNYDFRPVPELSGMKKALFYLLSLCIPIAGIVLFFVYRKKPVAEDRTAARMFLLLGVVSILFAGLCLPAYTATGFLIFQGGSF
ncbi:MAG: hypothetical protein IPK16_03875 [Anaerolineales bacterium]|nr:hypothetical protein [Anaerolineales bacterium]